MMKKMMWLSAICLILSVITACSGDKSQQKDSLGETEEQNVVTKNDAKPTELKQTYTADFNGRHYDIRLKRISAVDQPKVVDEFGTEFYDNRVEVNISCDGKVILDKDFTKSTFVSYLKESEKKETILLGMAYDAAHSNSQTICLGAQIGLVGIEEGPAFRVSIALNGGAVTIERDIEQDTTGDAGFDE